ATAAAAPAVGAVDAAADTAPVEEAAPAPTRRRRKATAAAETGTLGESGQAALPFESVPESSPETESATPVKRTRRTRSRAAAPTTVEDDESGRTASRRRRSRRTTEESVVEETVVDVEPVAEVDDDEAEDIEEFDAAGRRRRRRGRRGRGRGRGINGEELDE